MRKNLKAFVGLIIDLLPFIYFFGLKFTLKLVYDIMSFINDMCITIYDQSLISSLLQHSIVYSLVGVSFSYMGTRKGKIGSIIGKILYFIIGFVVGIILDFVSMLIF